MNRFGAPPEHSLNMLLLVRVRPYRDDHWEALKLRFGLEPQTGRTSALGHKHAFAAGPTNVGLWVLFRQIIFRVEPLESH